MAYPEVFVELLIIDELTALLAPHPEVFRDVAFLRDLDDRVLRFSRE